MKHADCERLARHSRSHAPWVRALAALVTLALSSAPMAGVTGLILESIHASRELVGFFYLWFWLTVMVVFFASLAGVTLWAIVRLTAIAIGGPAGPGGGTPRDVTFTDS